MTMTSSTSCQLFNNRCLAQGGSGVGPSGDMEGTYQQRAEKAEEEAARLREELKTASLDLESCKKRADAAEWSVAHLEIRLLQVQEGVGVQGQAR